MNGTRVQVPAPHRLWTTDDEASKEGWSEALTTAWSRHPRGLAGVAEDILGFSKQALANLLHPHEHAAPSLFDLARIAKRSPVLGREQMSELTRVLVVARPSTGDVHELLHRVRGEVSDVDKVVRPGAVASDIDLEKVRREAIEARAALDELIAHVDARLAERP